MEFTPFDDSSHSLFSTIVTVYILFFLYSPSILLRALFSPVLFITATLLLILLRFGSGKPPQPNPDHKEDHRAVFGNNNLYAKNCFEESFVEYWDVKAPLEVIYEDQCEDDEDANPDPDKAEEARIVGFERYPSLSRCYPETDSDSGSSTDGEFPVIGDWVSNNDFFFGWCDPDPDSDPDQDGSLIEIAMDSRGSENLDFQAEEENLIEIDIFQARSEEILGDKMGDPPR